MGKYELNNNKKTAVFAIILMATQIAQFVDQTSWQDLFSVTGMIMKTITNYTDVLMS